jgi:hypothetical protein
MLNPAKLCITAGPGRQATGLSSASGGVRQLCRSAADIARRGRRGRVSQSHPPAPGGPRLDWDVTASSSMWTQP